MIRFRSGGWDRTLRTSGIGAADRGQHRQAAGVIAPAVKREAEEDWGPLKRVFYLHRTSIPLIFSPHKVDLIKSALSQSW
jgi:hypothetical protein